MPTEREHLRDAISRGVRDVDGVFHRISDQVRAWADAFPWPWNRRIRKQVRGLVDGMLNRSVGLTVRAAMVSELYGVISRHVSFTGSGVFQRAGLIPEIVQAPAKLAKWVARAGRDAARVVKQTINRGGDIPAIADVLDPAKAPLTFKPNGQVVRQPDGISPHATSRARTAARMEISKAHTAATLEVAGQTSGAARFVLSALHPRTDKCDPLADQDVYGLGVGVYPVSACPRPPVHVGCLCHVEAVG